MRAREGASTLRANPQSDQEGVPDKRQVEHPRDNQHQQRQLPIRTGPSPAAQKRTDRPFQALELPPPEQQTLGSPGAVMSSRWQTEMTTGWNIPDWQLLSTELERADSMGAEQATHPNPQEAHDTWPTSQALPRQRICFSCCHGDSSALSPRQSSLLLDTEVNCGLLRSCTDGWP